MPRTITPSSGYTHIGPLISGLHRRGPRRNESESRHCAQRYSTSRLPKNCQNVGC